MKNRPAVILAALLAFAAPAFAGSIPMPWDGFPKDWQKGQHNAVVQSVDTRPGQFKLMVKFDEGGKVVSAASGALNWAILKPGLHVKTMISMGQGGMQTMCVGVVADAKPTPIDTKPATPAPYVKPVATVTTWDPKTRHGTLTPEGYRAIQFAADPEFKAELKVGDKVHFHAVAGELAK